MCTDSETIVSNPPKSRPDLSQHVRFAVEIAYREVALCSVLYFIQRIGALLNNDSISVPNDCFQLRLLALENLLEPV
jgi:hypothetical protein